MSEYPTTDVKKSNNFKYSILVFEIIDLGCQDFKPDVVEIFKISVWITSIFPRLFKFKKVASYFI